MNATELRDFLAQKFSEAELRQLTFDLGIDWDNLCGSDADKKTRAQALVEWCIRHGVLEQLRQAAQRARPYQWPEPARDEFMALGGMAGDVLGSSMAATQLERLARGMDELREDVAELVTKTEVMNQRMGMVEKRLEVLEQQAKITQPVGWQTWIVAIIGLVMSVVLVLAVLQLAVGR